VNRPPAIPAVSIVVPCFNEADGLREFHRRAAAAAMDAVGDLYEIVLVDDGSADGTWGVIATLAQQDASVVGIRLMRNHGHQAAASAGLTLARGRRVLLIDADLQDPPELLSPMMAEMDAGADVVYGQRTSRLAESWVKKSTAAAFYRVLSYLTSTPIPRDVGDFRLMTRQVVDALGAMPERQRFIRGMVSWIGGRQVPLLYERQARFAGSTKYPLRKMIRFALDAITSFSTVPLRIASYLGLIAAGFSLLLMVYTLVGWLRGDAVVGWPSVMTAVTLFGAVQLLVLGVMGEYIGRLFQESKARPLFLVERVVTNGTEHSLPAEFSALSPEARREVYASLRVSPVAVRV
jgi:glycosyltransferase involved in cell wall biosynthesis